MDVSENSGTPQSSILIGFSIINHPFWGGTPIFGNPHIGISHLSHDTSDWQDDFTFSMFEGMTTNISFKPSSVVS